MFDLSSPIARVRTAGRIEGISFLLLLGIAMPLKYLADQPLAVTIVGWIHGALFIALAMVTFVAWANRQLSFGQACLVAIASLIPFGPFLIDRKLRGAVSTSGLASKPDRLQKIATGFMAGIFRW